MRRLRLIVAMFVALTGVVIARVDAHDGSARPAASEQITRSPRSITATSPLSAPRTATPSTSSPDQQHQGNGFYTALQGEDLSRMPSHLRSTRVDA